MKVLFVGNSYTFYNDVPAQVAALAAADGQTIETEYVARGGADLEAHATETGAFERVADPSFTHVVLQEKSTGTLHDADDYHRNVQRLGERVRGQVLLYETWARQTGSAVYRWGWSGRSPVVMRRRVRRELEKAASDLDAEIVPVGTAWERAFERYPDLVLHDTDGHHASPAGSHLAACTFFAHLSKRDVTAVDWRPDDVPAGLSARLKSVAAAVT